MTHPYPSYTPGYVSIPRGEIMELCRRAVAWKRKQLEAEGHPCPDLLRAYEPPRECEVINGWATINLLGVWQTDEWWICRMHLETGRLRLYPRA